MPPPLHYYILCPLARHPTRYCGPRQPYECPYNWHGTCYVMRIPTKRRNSVSFLWHAICYARACCLIVGVERVCCAPATGVVWLPLTIVRVGGLLRQRDGVGCERQSVVSVPHSASPHARAYHPRHNVASPPLLHPRHDCPPYALMRYRQSVESSSVGEC